MASREHNCPKFSCALLNSGEKLEGALERKDKLDMKSKIKEITVSGGLTRMISRRERLGEIMGKVAYAPLGNMPLKIGGIWPASSTDMPCLTYS